MAHLDLSRKTQCLTKGTLKGGYFQVMSPFEQHCANDKILLSFCCEENLLSSISYKTCRISLSKESAFNIYTVITRMTWQERRRWRIGQIARVMRLKK